MFLKIKPKVFISVNFRRRVTWRLDLGLPRASSEAARTSKVSKSFLTFKTFRINFVVFFVFSRTALFSFFAISNSETLVKRGFAPAISFLFESHILPSVGGK